MISKIISYFTFVVIFLYGASAYSKEYIKPSVDYVAPIEEKGTTLLSLYAWNNYWIELWNTSLNKRCAGDIIRKQYSKKDYFEKELVKINKDLKSCYEKKYDLELTSEKIKKYEEDVVGTFGFLSKKLFTNYGNNHPLTYRELKGCLETVRMVESISQQLVNLSGYPNKGWCQKLD